MVSLLILTFCIEKIGFRARKGFGCDFGLRLQMNERETERERMGVRLPMPGVVYGKTHFAMEDLKKLKSTLCVWILVR